jgi:predicted nucleic acid-binding protein
MRFADTSFWVAFLRARETHHADARTLWLGSSDAVTTSELVLGETWTFLNRREGHHSAIRFLDTIGKSRRVLVSTVDGPVVDEAWRWLRRHDERVYSFVDSTSFAIMRRSRIREALAFDGDFTAAGFIESRPPAR